VRLADGLVALRQETPGEARTELAVVRLLRALAASDEAVTLVLPPEQARGVLTVGDLALICRMVRPGIELRVRSGRELVVPDPSGELAPVSAVPPSRELVDVASLAFGAIPIEWASYSDAIAAEHLGIPILGERGGEVVVGIDARDQAMAKEAGVEALGQARHLLSLVRDARRGRHARIDLVSYGVGRWLRAQDDRALERFEVGPLGRSPDRAFARRGATLYGFASGLNVLVVLEAALLLARAPRLAEVSFVLEGSPHPLVIELVRLLGMHARFESRSLSDGR